MSFKLLSEHLKNILGSKKRSNSSCPVCATERNEDNCKIIRETITELSISEPRWFKWFYGNDKEEAFNKLAQGIYGWACDSCLSSSAAIKADYKHQNFCDWPPYLAYVDEKLICRTCDSEFTFSKEEQLYWYEKLGFLVQSRAVNCKKCRKSLKESKTAYTKAQNEAESLKKTIDLKDSVQISKLISLYEKTESHKQVAFYKKVLKNLERKQSEEHSKNSA